MILYDVVYSVTLLLLEDVEHVADRCAGGDFLLRRFQDIGEDRFAAHPLRMSIQIDKVRTAAMAVGDMAAGARGFTGRRTLW